MATNTRLSATVEAALHATVGLRQLIGPIGQARFASVRRPSSSARLRCGRTVRRDGSQ